MLKSLLKIVGSFFLVLILIFIGAAVWYGFNSAKYEEVAAPYVSEAMPRISTWHLSEFESLLTPEALEVFETEKGAKVLTLFSKLGELESFEDPQFLNASAGATVESGAYDIVNFSVLGHYTNGDATLTITLATVGDSYQIQNIHINSDVFLD